jgi:hypothetical protein
VEEEEQTRQGNGKGIFKKEGRLHDLVAIIDLASMIIMSCLERGFPSESDLRYETGRDIAAACM